MLYNSSIDNRKKHVVLHVYSMIHTLCVCKCVASITGLILYTLSD